MNASDRARVVSLSGDPVEYYSEAPRAFALSSGDSAAAALKQHIECHFGPIDGVFHELVSDAVRIDVEHVAPSTSRPYHVLVTLGVSNLAMNVPANAEVPAFVELMIKLPRDWRVSAEAFADANWYWPVRQLKTLARFPHKYQTWIGNGHTVTNGDPPQPLAPSTALCGAILLEPLAAPDGFLALEASPDKTIRFLTVIPLYQEEMALKLRAGANALIARFRQHGITDVIDPVRRNVAHRSFAPF